MRERIGFLFKRTRASVVVVGRFTLVEVREVLVKSMLVPVCGFFDGSAENNAFPVRHVRFEAGLRASFQISVAR